MEIWETPIASLGDTFVGLPNLDKVFAFWAIVPSWIIVPLLMLDQGLPETESALASFRTPSKVSFRLNHSNVKGQ